MARKIDDIKREILLNWLNHEIVQQKYEFPFNPDDADEVKLKYIKKASVENLLFTVVSTAIWLFETILDQFKADVEYTIQTKARHNLQWYADMAGKFQKGHALLPGTNDYAEVAGPDDSSLIIKHVAVTDRNGKLELKVAKEKNGVLAPLDRETIPEQSISDELSAFTSYMQQVKDAGVRIEVISLAGNAIRIELDIVYDPLVLNNKGMIIREGEGQGTYPVFEKIKEYINNLPFNGEFAIAHLEDTLQATIGVVLPRVKVAQTMYAEGKWENVDVMTVPYSGYLVIEDEGEDKDIKINYVAYGQA